MKGWRAGGGRRGEGISLQLAVGIAIHTHGYADCAHVGIFLLPAMARRDIVELNTGATAKRALTPTPTRVEARDHWHLLVARSVRVQACVDLSVFARA